MKELFVELHEGSKENPRAILIAVADIRAIRAVSAADAVSMDPVSNFEDYQTRIMFKGGAWFGYVHESMDEVAGLCGLTISR